MSIPRIAKAMDHIDDDLISGAVEYKSAKKKNTWVKWGAIAACLCLVLAFTIPTISNVLERNGGADPVEDIAPFAFNGAYYEYTDNADILEKYGLSRVLTADDAGQHFAFLQKVGAEYKETVQETDIELYDYAKVSCKGVMVIRDGDKYGAALFCNFIFGDSNDCVDFSEIYRVYGVGRAEDIASICEFNGTFGNEKQENLTTDREAIEQFYNASLNLISYGNDDWQETEVEVYATGEERVQHYNDLTEDATNLRIETTDGLVFCVRAYPTYGWLEGILSYYRFNDEISVWFSKHLQ